MFENLKKGMLSRIERDCVKSELGGRMVYLKKSKLPLIGGEWQEINPPVNENGTWNLVNLIFGGKKNLAILLFVFAIIVMVYFQFKTNFNYIDRLTNNPCVKICLESVVN